MKFKDLIKMDEAIASNTAQNRRITNAIHAAVAAEILDWGVQYTTAEFVHVLGIDRRTLDHYINSHDFNADNMTISYSGNQHEFVDLGPEPVLQVKGPDEQNWRVFELDLETDDPFQDIQEGAKVSSLQSKDKDKLWMKFLKVKQKKKKLSKKEVDALKKEFDKKELLDVGKEIQKG